GIFFQRSVSIGDVVIRGQKIAEAGGSGVIGGQPIYGFLVLRLTNLTGARSYVFQPLDYSMGFNGAQGTIDPFGWAAPTGVDPWAYRYIGFKDPWGYAAGVTDPGAFSIALWRPGAAPPTNN